jgi:ribosome maturation factor RimP
MNTHGKGGKVDLAEAATALLEPLGYEVLELTTSGKGNKRNLLLRIDRLDGGVVTMDDVETATGVFSLELDRLDPFEGEYNLEVESPGPERPLKTAAHFRRFAGLLAKVRAHGETFTGRVDTVGDDHVTFDVKGQKRELKLSEVQARLAEWPDTPR